MDAMRSKENLFQFWYRWLAAYVIFFGLFFTSILLVVSFALWAIWPIALLLKIELWRVLIAGCLTVASIQTLGRWAGK